MWIGITNVCISENVFNDNSFGISDYSYHTIETI